MSYKIILDLFKATTRRLYPSPLRINGYVLNNRTTKINTVTGGSLAVFEGFFYSRVVSKLNDYNKAVDINAKKMLIHTT